MLETLTDKETNIAVSQPISRESAPVATPTSKGARPRVMYEYAIRSALGVGVILAWIIVPMRPMLTGLLPTQVAPTPAQVASPQTAQATPSKTESFMPTLDKARMYCPPNAPVLMLADGVAPSQLADYFVYPRRVDLILLADPFSATDLDAHAGGCLVYYGSQAAQRLDPFKARLKEIICSDGCLYHIER